MHAVLTHVYDALVRNRVSLYGQQIVHCIDLFTCSYVKFMTKVSFTIIVKIRLL